MRRVRFPDGTIREYPAGTDDETIRAEVRRATAERSALGGRPAASGPFAALRRGVTLGLSDEAAGVGTAIGDAATTAFRGGGLRDVMQAAGRGYGYGRREELGRVNQFRRSNPMTSAAVEITGGLGSMGPAVVNAPQFFNAGAGALSQALARPRPIAVGATAGAAGGENVQERATGAAIGGGLSAVLAPLGRTAASRASTPEDWAINQYGAALRDARRDPLQEMAPVRIGRELPVGREGVTPDQMVSAATRLQRNIPGVNATTLMETLPRLQRNAMAVTTVGGPGQGVVGRALQEQAEGVGQRTLGTVSRATGQEPLGFRNQAIIMSGERNARAQQLYADAYATPLDQPTQQQLIQMIAPTPNAPEAEQALARRALAAAREVAATEARFLQARLARHGPSDDVARQLEEVRRAATQLQQVEAGEAQEIGVRAMHYYTRGMSNMVRDPTNDPSGIMAARGGVERTIRDAVPQYDRAQVEYMTDKNVEDAFDQAYQAFIGRSGPTVDMLDQFSRFGYSNAQKRAAAMGVLEGINHRFAMGDAGPALRALQKPAMQTLLRDIYGKKQATRIIRRLLVEGQSAGRRARLGVWTGSPTAPRIEAVREATTEAENGFVDFVVQNVRSGGFEGPIRQFVANLIESANLPGIRDPRKHEALANVLTTPFTPANVQRLNTRLAERMRRELRQRELSDASLIAGTIQTQAQTRESER